MRSLPSAVVSTEPIKALLDQAFPDADEVRVIDRGGGDHLEVHVTDASLQGLSLIDQHRRVNDVLGGAGQGRHHPRAAHQDERNTRAVSYDDKIKEIIEESEVALFMKGTPDAIMCGNSERALGALRRAGAPITAVDVLADMQIREDLSAAYGWPTIPQVFVKGELIGGADIVEEMERSGDLEQTLVEKLGDEYWERRGERTIALV